MLLRSPRRAGVALVAVAVVLSLPSVARADEAPSLSVTDAAGAVDPVARVARTVTLTGSTASATRIWVQQRPAGGAPCAASASADPGRPAFEEGFQGDGFSGARVDGAFRLQRTGVWTESGPRQVCIWLAQQAGDAATPVTQVVDFRPPTGTISATVSQPVAFVGQTVTVALTGATESAARVFLKTRATGGAPCAATYAADAGRDLVNGTAVDGTFRVERALAARASGGQLICAWLAASAGDATSIAGPQSVVFGALAPASACVVPALPGGTSLYRVAGALLTASCKVGGLVGEPSAKHPLGTFLRFVPGPGTSLTTGTPVAVVLSSGRPCRVPAVTRRLRLAAAKTRLGAAGCRVGRVTRVRSARRRGRVVRFAPGSGRTLEPGARVAIRVSRGR